MYKTSIINKEMDKAKDPAMILSVVDLMGLVGATYYFYKANEDLELKITGQQKVIAGLVQRLTNLEKLQQHKNEGLTTLNDKIKELGETVDLLPSLDYIDTIGEDITEIAAVLQDNNINLELPSQIARSHISNRRSTRDTRDTEYNRSTIGKRGVVRSSRDTDSRPRGSRGAVKIDQREARVQTAGHYEEEEDADLIENVRRQHGS